MDDVRDVLGNIPSPITTVKLPQPDRSHSCSFSFITPLLKRYFLRYAFLYTHVGERAFQRPRR